VRNGILPGEFQEFVGKMGADSFNGLAIWENIHEFDPSRARSMPMLHDLVSVEINQTVHPSG
jgi:hypothetical protein